MAARSCACSPSQHTRPSTDRPSHARARSSVVCNDEWRGGPRQRSTLCAASHPEDAGHGRMPGLLRQGILGGAARVGSQAQHRHARSADCDATLHSLRPGAQPQSEPEHLMTELMPSACRRGTAAACARSLTARTT